MLTKLSKTLSECCHKVTACWRNCDYQAPASKCTLFSWYWDNNQSLPCNTVKFLRVMDCSHSFSLRSAVMTLRISISFLICSSRCICVILVLVASWDTFPIVSCSSTIFIWCRLTSPPSEWFNVCIAQPTSSRRSCRVSTFSTIVCSFSCWVRIEMVAKVNSSPRLLLFLELVRMIMARWSHSWATESEVFSETVCRALMSRSKPCASWPAHKSHSNRELH